MAKKQPKPYPNKNTLWAYHMQSIELNSTEINVAFPEYHPMWVIQSQQQTVGAENFRVMRESIMRLTVEQCAAYLRVSDRSIRRWESGARPVPFAAFELLRVVIEANHFRLSNKGWQGWFIDDSGRLVSPDRADTSFVPEDLSFIRETHQFKAYLVTENKRLLAELAPLKAELDAIRGADMNHRFLDELAVMQAQLIELANQVTKNNVFNIGASNKSPQPTLEVKAA